MVLQLLIRKIYYSNKICYCQAFYNNFRYNAFMNFGEKLKELRTEKGCSQADIAKIVGTTKMAISHWERGHSEPSITQLIILSDFFGVTTDYLVGKEN